MGDRKNKQDKLVLFTYFRSSCAWRVRNVLEYKGLEYKMEPVQIRKSEQFKNEFLKVNPMGQVPALVINDNTTLFQSIAIMEYLEERYPEKRLLPADLTQRAFVRSICELIASGIQPLQNLSTLDEHSNNDDEKLAWAQRWINRGFTALEKVLAQTSGKYCVGNEVTLADCCLVPQVYNAFRYKVDTNPFPIAIRITETLSSIPAFERAHPQNQPDCPPELYSKY